MTEKRVDHTERVDPEEVLSAAVFAVDGLWGPLDEERVQVIHSKGKEKTRLRN